MIHLIGCKMFPGPSAIMMSLQQTKSILSSNKIMNQQGAGKKLNQDIAKEKNKRHDGISFQISVPHFPKESRRLLVF